MTRFHASSTIQATPEKIWRILTDAPNYPAWNPSVIRIEGRIAQGEQIKVFSTLSPERAFPVTVQEFIPNQKMTWVGGMPLGLFKGVRTFTLTPRPDGSVDFSLEEVFSGLLLPVMGRTLPDMSESFQQYANGLKAAAEKA